MRVINELTDGKIRIERIMSKGCFVCTILLFLANECTILLAITNRTYNKLHSLIKCLHLIKDFSLCICKSFVPHPPLSFKWELN